MERPESFVERKRELVANEDESVFENESCICRIEDISHKDATLSGRSLARNCRFTRLQLCSAKDELYGLVALIQAIK